MSRGESGRIVIEVDAELKRRLYSVLALSNSTLKDWFIQSATRYCDTSIQHDLFSPADTGPESPGRSIEP
jgi:hypothetical protein